MYWLSSKRHKHVYLNMEWMSAVQMDVDINMGGWGGGSATSMFVKVWSEWGGGGGGVPEACLSKYGVNVCYTNRHWHCLCLFSRYVAHIVTCWFILFMYWYRFESPWYDLRGWLGVKNQWSISICIYTSVHVAPMRGGLSRGDHGNCAY